MSEIAEELERLADELEGRERGADHRMSSEVDIGEISYWSGRSAAHHIDAKRLRERAAEIRARRSAPTYASQPKPDAVRTGQWWMFADSDAFRITDVDSLSALGISKTHVPMGGRPREMLRSALWLYLGNGSEPARM